MSLWTNMRDPLYSTEMGVGPLPGVGYDAYTNQGVGQKSTDPYSDPYGGMPQMPGFNPIYNPLTMDLTPQVNQQLQGIDTSGLDQSVSNFRDLADRQGPSAWATLAGQQQNQLMSNELERGAAENNSATAAAEDRLASSGGLSSGARERAAEGGATNLMNMSQNAGRQNTLNQLQIGVNDQQNKMQQMGMLPGMEEQALAPKFQKENIWQNAATQNQQNTMNENNAINQYNQNRYQTQANIWGAGKNADAIAMSNKNSFNLFDPSTWF